MAGRFPQMFDDGTDSLSGTFSPVFQLLEQEPGRPARQFWCDTPRSKGRREKTEIS